MHFTEYIYIFTLMVYVTESITLIFKKSIDIIVWETLNLELHNFKVKLLLHFKRQNENICFFIEKL